MEKKNLRTVMKIDLVHMESGAWYIGSAFSGTCGNMQKVKNEAFLAMCGARQDSEVFGVPQRREVTYCCYLALCGSEEAAHYIEEYQPETLPFYIPDDASKWKTARRVSVGRRVAR